MNSEEKIMPPTERPNVVLGTTFTADIYDQIVAIGKKMGLKDNEVVRLAVGQLVSKF
jgi:hypothetical protein